MAYLLPRRRVVVTGLGLVTPLATGVKNTWDRLLGSQSGIISLTDTPGYESFADLPVTIAGVVKSGSKNEGRFDASEWLDRGDDRVMTKFTQYFMAAAKQALADAEWITPSDEEKLRTGVCVGSGLGGLEDLVSTSNSFKEQGYKKLSPMFIPKLLVNMAGGHLTMKFGFRGPNHAVSTACTTGAHSIGDAMRFIQYGDADVMIAGGSEACVHPLAVAGFCKAKSLATGYNSNPTEASRPFDRDRSGFVVSEGAGVVVLEELEHARRRGARVYAEMRGYGLSSDAHHITAPPDDGNGAARAMARALEVAGLGPAEVDYVNAHATSTSLGDAAENRAIKSIFAGHTDHLAVSSTKGAIGHLLGAAGAVEAVFTILSIYHNVLPPTLNLHNPGDPAEDFMLNYVPRQAQDRTGNGGVRAALTNSFGFGGTNASLCFAKALKEQNAPKTPTAYFAALMTTLEAQKNAQGRSEIRTAILYLLDIVFPRLPQSVLRSKFPEVLVILATSLEKDKAEAPTIRSVIGCLETLLIAQDTATWIQATTKKAFQTLLVLSIDPRPKVRKRAQDASRKILTHLPPPTVQHPAAPMTADFCLRVLKECTKTDQQSALHVLALVKMIVAVWPSSRLHTYVINHARFTFAHSSQFRHQHYAPLCEIMLQLPKFNKPFLTMSSFEVFESLFGSESISFDAEKFEEVLRAICELKPSVNDEQLMPPWLEIVGKGYPAFAKINPTGCAAALLTLFHLIFPDMQTHTRTIYLPVARCLGKLTLHCITDDMISVALATVNSGTKTRTPLQEIIAVVENGLGIRYQAAWNEVLVVLQALFKVRRRLHRASSPLLNDALELMGELRLAPEDTYIERLEAALGSAVAHIGPEKFLQVLPLNLENPGTSNAIGRAFLLPLLKDHITNTEMGYFVRELIPLGDRLAQKSQEFTDKGRAIEAKVYETMAQQIWSLVPGFCDLPLDLPHAFTKTIAERFSNVLYSQPDLRPVISQGLQALVEKNQALARSDADDVDLKKAYGLSKADAVRNVQIMSAFAVNYLAVYFNVFSQTLPMYRGYILDVIKCYLGITNAKDTNATFKKVLTHLSQSLVNSTPAINDPTIPPPMSYTMMDLAITMVPFLSTDSTQHLYALVTSSLLSREDEPTLQKKTYKVLNRMAECETGRAVLLHNINDLQTRLLDAMGATAPSSKKDRLQTLLNTVELLPSTDLHLIPSVLSEAVVCTKEVNEKARILAYDLLVSMGKKMREGGTVVNSKVDGMEEDMPDVKATIAEYFMMVTAGLAGSTPHMISATITSLSRLLFEFKDSLNPSLVSDLLQTMHMFVESSNREIVKSALGFVKVATVSLEPHLLQPHLPQIVLGILTWSHEHKSHFKAKVRHIFERLIRKFGYEKIETLVPEDDKKLLVNIKKRRERAKRKKAANAEMESDGEEAIEELPAVHHGKSYNNAYEDALYGSESELEDSEEEESHGLDAGKEKRQKEKNKKQISETWIKEDMEGPLDFLDRGVVGRITSSKPTPRKGRRVTGDDFTTGEDGRMMINESDSDADAAGIDEDGAAVAENHYLQAQRSEDGFTRGQGNRIKFNKRRRGEAAGDEDMMDVDEPTREPGAEKKRSNGKGGVVMLGKEYKAKRAGGDIKKKGKPDPYAYLPLTKAIKKKGQRGPTVSVTGKARK
ncbi:hypothetical protein BC938DRAFT_478477 [Jimgerdemannia flammicorona]|uniref:3-oxoacyl-[acyl-carrier-protein] synthase, mitochondrial n=1 Tax=Jimgerdemannia flammicorona TaxID=994334 RepID=A0A433R0J9_9FUNG|nr:hypothetical protein BC938DRAFT_478477 [Jimgerdemannia flammicorona]